MKVYDPKDIRNVALFGHAGAGKTTFVESALFNSGAINRRGTVEDHNTASDYNELEHERGCSVFATPFFIEQNDVKVNIIDTPGYDDYIGEVAAAARIVDTGIILINAQTGLEVGSENAVEYLDRNEKPLAFVINRLDVDQANFDARIEELKDRFGNTATVIQFPLKTGVGFNSIIDIISMKLYEYTSDSGKPEVKEIPDSEKEKAENFRNELMESVAETDEELMNKYFEAGELTPEELASGLKTAMVNKQIYPVFCSSAKGNIGVDRIIDIIVSSFPSPLEMPAPKTDSGDEIVCHPNGPKSLFVFKLVSEAHLGDLTFFRIMSGTIEASNDLINEQKNNSERFNQLYLVAGKKRVEVDKVAAGDIAATVKLKQTHIGDTLHEKGKDIEFPATYYPSSKVRTAIVPETKGEEEKVGMGLNSLHLEDPTLVVEHSKELRQTILHAQGELHLSAAKWRLENRYKVKAKFVDAKVPYRETIQKQVKGSYRHKKQSGGAGQFAEVHMMVEPYSEGMPNPEGLSVRGKDLHELDWGGKLEFVNCIVGGVIDQRFLPAILKGVMEKMVVGPLTGSYVRDIRVTIYDGKMHPVDSNEAAFKTAGMMVFKDNFVQAAPKLLEPIYEIKVKVPEDFVGDVMSDLPSRRGVILGVDTEGRYQVIKARMPLAELDKYATALRSMTQARATYTSEFIEYQTVPPMVQEELVSAYKKSLEEE
jgi:elongation factor G